MSKQERFDEYDESVNTEYDFGKDPDLMNSILEEIEYYGLLVRNDVVEESDYLSVT